MEENPEFKVQSTSGDLKNVSCVTTRLYSTLQHPEVSVIYDHTSSNLCVCIFLFGSASDYHEQTADSPERWQPLQLGLAAQLPTFLRRRTHSKQQKNLWRDIPKDV